MGAGGWLRKQQVLSGPRLARALGGWTGPDHPLTPPPFLPSLATTTKDWAGGWRDWHRLGQAYCLCSPALDPLPGTVPSPPPLPPSLLPEEPAMSQDTWFLLDSAPHTQSTPRGPDRPWALAGDGISIIPGTYSKLLGDRGKVFTMRLS